MSVSALDPRVRSSELFESAPFGVAIVSSTGEVRYANPALVAIVAVETPIISGTPLATVLPAPWLAMIASLPDAKRDAAESITVPGIVVGTVHRLTRIPISDGALLTVSEPLLRPAEPAARVAPNETRRRLVFQPDGLADIVSRSPDVVVRFDRDLRYLFVNEAIRAFSDIDPASLIGRSTEEVTFFAGDTDDRYRRRIREVLETGREASHVDTVVTELGEFVLHGRLIPEFDRQGVVGSVLGITRDVTDLVRGHMVWTGTEALNRSLLDSIPASVMGIDARGVVVSMNAPGRHLMELDAETSVIGEHWTILGPFPAHATIERAVASAIDGMVETFVTMAPTFAGNPRWWETVVAPVLSGQAAVAEVLMISRDVTDAHVRERALEVSRARFQRLYDANVIGLLFHNLDGTLVDANPAYLALTGLRREELATGCVTMDTLTPPRYRARDREAAEELTTFGVCEPYQKELQRPDGALVPVLVGAAATPDDIADAIAYVVDLTTLRAAERDRSDALQRERDAHGIAVAAEAQFRSLFNGAAESILVADDGGRIIAANPGAEELLGYPERVLTTFSVDDIAPRGHLLMGFPPRDGRSSKIRSGEHELSTRDGGVVRAESRSRAVRTADGSVLHYISLRDVSERRLLEQIHQESIDSISHDLKNPLAAIRAQAQLLGRRVERNRLDESYLIEAMASINNGVERMTSQLDDLLEVARLRAGAPLELRRATVDLGELIGQWVADYQRTTERHILTMDPIDGRVACSVDVNRIERVVTNLLSNAIKYSDGGVIRVSVGWQPADPVRTVAITVIDQGIGIPADEVPLVFERFRRGSNVDGRAGGSGIGLAGVRQIVQQHGGTIAVESRVGAGSAFTVRIPCEAD